MDVAAGRDGSGYFCEAGLGRSAGRRKGGDRRACEGMQAATHIGSNDVHRVGLLQRSDQFFHTLSHFARHEHYGSPDPRVAGSKVQQIQEAGLSVCACVRGCHLRGCVDGCVLMCVPLTSQWHICSTTYRRNRSLNAPVRPDGVVFVSTTAQLSYRCPGCSHQGPKSTEASSGAGTGMHTR